MHKLGYRNTDGYLAHPDKRIAIFVGDFIDRGPRIRETLQIVKPMVKNGSALAVIGNHEYNAICFNTLIEGENFLREHSDKNIHQHIATIHAFNNHRDEWYEYLEWFKTLPIYLEINGLRVIHAYWSNKNIDFLKYFYPDNRLTQELLFKSSDSLSTENRVVDELLKGPELELPEGNKFIDKDGNIRGHARIKWWHNNSRMTYSELAFTDEIIDTEIPESILGMIELYDAQSPPVFFGHYWLNGNPQILSSNTCCLDYSVAKGGYLVAYRWDGEQVLSNDKLTSVKVLK